MQFKIEKNSLLKGITTVLNAIPNRTTIPVLEGIFIEAKDNKLILTTSDLEIGIEYIIDDNVEIKKEGAIVVPAITFTEIVRRMPELDIDIVVDKDGILKLECKGSKYQLSTMNADEYPKLPEIKIENSIILEQRNLKNLIKQTNFSVSSDENRKLYTGALFNAEKDKLTVIALDGFRLAIRGLKRDVKGDNKKEFKVVIPGKSLNEVAKILDESFDTVSIGTDKGQAIFQLDNCKIITKTLDGDFLNYNSLLETEPETTVKVNRLLFLESLERVMLISTAKEKKEPVTISVSVGKMNLNCISTIGNADEELVVETEGKDTSLRFNPKFFMDVLRNIEDEEVNINFSTSVSPCLITPVDKDRDYTYIILPLRNND